jgi:hypothetical protein
VEKAASKFYLRHAAGWRFVGPASNMSEPPQSPAAHARGARAGLERAWLLAVFAAVACFYWWTARGDAADWKFGQRQTDYYNLLLHGFLKGQLSMDVGVAPELLRLENPYDPAQRPPGAALHDATLYRGKYYLYFGAAPVVTLLLPFRLLTGIDLPMPAGVFVFSLAGFPVGAAVFLGIRRRYFPEAGIGVVVLGLLALAAMGMAPVLLRRSSIWELPLSSGAFFAVAAVGCVWRHLHAERRREWWLAAASLGLGLAVASRPVYLYAVGVLLVPIAWRWWEERKLGAGVFARWRGTALAGLAPLAAVGLVMAWYNFARFGDPAEFGVKYQFSGIFEEKTRHFSLAYFPFNFRLYFLQAAEWLRYFPFVQAAAPPLKPEGHLGFEESFGVLVNMPLLWLAPLAGLAVWQCATGARERLGAWLVATAALAVGPAGVLSFFYAAMARYQADFMPAATLLALVGLLAGERAVDSWRPAWRRVARFAGVGLAAFSIFFAVMLSLRLYDLFRLNNPRSFARLAWVFDLPAHWFERLAGTRMGPLETEVRFPERPAQTREPLLTTGAFAGRERLFVQYEDGNRVRIGHARGASVGALSRAVKVDPRTTHRLRVEMGALGPPREHPAYGGWDAGSVARSTQRLRVELDGEVLLDEAQRFHPASPGTLQIGRDAAPLVFAPRFSGEVVAVGREALAPPPSEDGVILRLKFPAAQPRAQPLFTTAGSGGPMVWFSESRGDGELRFGCARSDGVVWRCEWIEANLGKVHELSFKSIGGAAPRSVVQFDGVVVGTAPAGGALREAPAALGKNRTAFAECAAEFAGVIFGSELRDDFAGGESPPFATLRVEARLPAGRTGASEPLVVTGEPGRGDFLFIEYLDADRVRFGLDHWGKPPVKSEPVRIDFAATHVFEIELESWVDRLNPAPERVAVRIDGTPVWERRTKLYAVAPSDVSVGRNTIGGTACERVFTGELLRVERVAAQR